MKQSFSAKRLLCTLTLLALSGASCVLGQVSAPSSSGSGIGTFVSFGGLRTHVVDYTYNALGIDGGVYVQPSPRFGLEARVASFPLYARYPQMPITGGYRMDIWQPRGHDWQFSGYLGGGYSRSTDAGAHYHPLPAQWSPCWQASTALTVRIGILRWKPYEASYYETLTPLRALTGYSLTTGFNYTFSGIGRRP